MERSRPPIVESHHHHLWTDALHARAIAHQAHNRWDRGTYVRWAVNTAWTALEIACQKALEDDRISYSFRQNLDEAIRRKSLPNLDWRQGLWQKVNRIHETRKDYVHRFLTQSDLFPEAEVADNAIAIIREAIISIYNHANRVPPVWVQEDENLGWDSGGREGATATLIRSGASEDDPNVIKIYIIRNNQEHAVEVLPPGTDPMPYVEDLIPHVNVPISGIRVYEGNNLVHDRSLQMRGN